MINLPAARTIAPADVTLPPTLHIDITWLLEEVGASRRPATDQTQ